MKMQRSTQRGIALLEVMIATVILAIGLLGTVGLQARAYASLNDAGQRAEATIASEKLFGLMSTDLGNLSSYALAEGGAGNAVLTSWLAETKVAIPSANPSITITPTSSGTDSTQVTVVIKWQRKAGDASTANSSTVTSFLSGSK